MATDAASGSASASSPRRLVGLTIGDDPHAWRSLGFAVDGDHCTVGGVTLHLVGAGGPRGLLAWSLAPEVEGSVDGLAHREPRTATAEVAQPNGVTGVDHVVVGTPQVDRTIEALGAIGLAPRRRVEGLRGGDKAYAFFLLGTCVLEVIGPADVDPDRTPGPAAFVGLAFVADDLAGVTARDGLAGAPRDAIQPGRRIVTLRTQSRDVSVPLAVLTPRRRSSNSTRIDSIQSE